MDVYLLHHGKIFFRNTQPCGDSKFLIEKKSLVFMGTNPDFGWGVTFGTKVSIDIKLDLGSDMYWGG